MSKKITADYFDKDYFESNSKSNYGSYMDYPFFKDFAYYVWKKFLPRTLLEVGCAKGFMVKWFNRLGVDAFGVDISKYAVDNCPPEIANKMTCGDFSQTRWSGTVYDLVLCLETTEHIPEEKMESFIKNLYDSTGEWCIITTPIVPKGYVREDDPKKDNDESHISLHDKDYWCDAFKKAGFEFTGMFTWYVPKVESGGVDKNISINVEAPVDKFWRNKYVMVLKK